MKKILFPLLIIVTTLVLCSVILPMGANAGNAGVGVINVPPKYGYIRVEQQENFIRVYLNISDYNSWADVHNVTVTLDNYGAKISTFVFQQYKNLDSYVEINEFSEIPEDRHLLVNEKCFFEKSNQKETIDERCDIAVRFVFQKTFFTGISIAINDRDGSAPAEAYIYYNTEETMRGDTNIAIPWIGILITIDIPPYLVDLIALTLGAIGVIYYVKKTGIIEKRRVTYEKI